MLFSVFAGSFRALGSTIIVIPSTTELALVYVCEAFM